MSSGSPPLLGFAIPTFNRAEELGALLATLRSEIGDADVAVSIADNSTDLRCCASNRAAAMAIGATYVGGDGKNIGFDHNVLRAVESCPAQYVWLFSDDDLLHPGALRRVEEILREVAPDLLVVNWDVRSRALDEVRSDRFVPVRADRAYGSDGSFVRDLGSSVLCFMSCIVVRRERWMRVDPARYVGSEMVHLPVVLEGCSGGKVYLHADPMITQRADNSVFAARYYELFFVKQLAVYAALASAGLDAKDLRRARYGLRHKGSYWRAYLVMHGAGILTPKVRSSVARSTAELRLRGLAVWIRVLPLLPRVLARVLEAGIRAGGTVRRVLRRGPARGRAAAGTHPQACAPREAARSGE